MTSTSAALANEMGPSDRVCRRHSSRAVESRQGSRCLGVEPRRSGDFASYGVSPATPGSGYESFDVRYNADGLPISIGMASGLALGREYDVATGLLRAVTTPSRTHSYEYGVDGQLGRVVTSVGETVIDEVAYTYANRRLTGFARSGHSTETYDYDGAGNLTLVRDAASQAVLESRTHDTSNQLVTHTTADGVESFAYDARGRLTTRARSGEPSTAYRYDGFDQLEGVSAGSIPVALSMRRAVQPRWPSSTTCCRFVSLKTLLMAAARHFATAAVNVSAQLLLPVLGVHRGVSPSDCA